MSFGFGIGDFIAVGDLALKVYRNYRDAPEQFRAISTEVGSLHLMLKDVDTTIKGGQLSSDKEADLRKISEGCRSVLDDLDKLLEKYRNVGKKTRWSWDRFKWHQDDIREMRERIVVTPGTLNAFNLSLTSSAVSRIEMQLIQLRAEFQSGKREGSVITVKSMVAAEGGDENVWREISQELEDAGITQETINEHREFIASWVINALRSGELEEKPLGHAAENFAKSQEDEEASLSESFQDINRQDEPYVTSDVEEDRDQDFDSDSEDGADEFLSGVAQKITEFQQLGREAMEASDYEEAQRHLVKARDLAILLFGDDSRKAKESNSILAEIFDQNPVRLREGVVAGQILLSTRAIDFEPEQQDYRRPLQEFFQFIQYSLISTEDNIQRKVVSFELVKEYFDEEDRLIDVLFAVFPEDDPLPVDESVVQESYLKTFCILLLIGAASYIRYIVQDESFSDAQLPHTLQPEHFPVSSSRPGLWDAFYEKQWIFCEGDNTRSQNPKVPTQMLQQS